MRMLNEEKLFRGLKVNYCFIVIGLFYVVKKIYIYLVIYNVISFFLCVFVGYYKKFFINRVGYIIVIFVFNFYLGEFFLMNVEKCCLYGINKE